MAAIAQHKTLGPVFNNEESIVQVSYDHAVDGGATGVLDLFTAAENIVITHFHASVTTLCTSTGSATVIAGISGVDTDLFFNTTQGAVANLTAGAVLIPPAVTGTPNALPLPYNLASGGKIIQTIGTETLGAGKIKYTIKYIKA